MLRFAILDHDQPVPHWDFLLESVQTLRAWRLLAEPVRARAIVAEPLPDHRPIYLDYEGPVGGGRGRVSRWDSGIFAWECDGPDEVRMAIRGNRVIGTVTLRRT